MSSRNIKNREVWSPEDVAASSSDELHRLYDQIVADIPTKSAIFLPTDKLPLKDKVIGLLRVREIYENGLQKKYRPRLRSLKEKFIGRKRCFIIGNGPSLNHTDLSCLKDEVTFAVNGFFLKSQELDWTPTFYVVEDHLVAEDRREFINQYKGPTKLFPASLGYCFEEADDTIFFNHRPRKSYPHGFDFSTNAEEITYAGCTVTFTCIQLAYYMGFEEIYLIGVDSDYTLPKDIEESKDYGVGVLDMQSNDPNHFHPDYFGKGFRWHDPQVDKMLQAYAEAKNVIENNGRKIFNATIGGKLEVFTRIRFDKVFPQSRSPEELREVTSANQDGMAAGEPRKKADHPNTKPPRLLVFDVTARGDGTATGELKATLFSVWPNENFLQFFSTGKNVVGRAHGENLDEKKILQIARDFDPELILYRPVPQNLALHNAAMFLIRSIPVPYVIWIMDDWPTMLAERNLDIAPPLSADLCALLEGACLRLSICDAMSEALAKRYGVPFESLSNAVRLEDWPLIENRNRKPDSLLIRYAGSLAENMTLNSVIRTAEAVEEIANHGLDVRFEIKTKKIWQDRAHARLSFLSRTRFVSPDEDIADYRSWLSQADCVLIGYNFDADSISYVRYSMANKLPECLASGAALIVHGPLQVATVRYAHELGCAVVVAEDDKAVLIDALVDIIKNPEKRLELGRRGREIVFSCHNLNDVQSSFVESLNRAKREKSENRMSTQFPYPRDAHAYVDETKVIAHLFKDLDGPNHVLIDVGAHVGGSAEHFVPKGWQIFCFEPDSENRKRLIQKFKATPNVLIDARAVSDQEAHQKAFFVSTESTGISGLHAFRKTHRQSERVDVTTVADIVKQHALTQIDFLKIDVEGFDFAVLKGVPWSNLKPDIIECEFEDAKTLPLGHTYKDVADFLTNHGYTVYLSEWHPIIRYGIPHDWCRVIKYPDALFCSEAWGNLLAFRSDPGLPAVRRAFDACIRLRTAPSTGLTAKSVSKSSISKSSVSKPKKSNRSLKFDHRWIMHRLWEISPVLFRMSQMAILVSQAIKRRPWRALISGMSALLLALLLITTVDHAWGSFWAIMGVFVLASGALIASAAYDKLQVALRQLRKEIDGLNASLDTAKNQISDLENIADVLEKKVSMLIDSTLLHGQSFNRFLDNHHIEILQKKWGSLLDEELTAPALSYLAHRIRHIEQNSQGRLATSIEDASLRVLASSAATGTTLEVLEIGTLFGIGLAMIYDRNRERYKSLHVTAIDPLHGYYSKGAMDFLLNIPVTQETFWRNMDRAGVPRSDVTLIDALSTDQRAREQAASRHYDILIIDGDHTYNGVKADYELYHEFVKPGGLIIFDDYNSPHWPDIKQFVDAEVLNNPNMALVGTEWHTCVVRVMKPES